MKKFIIVAAGACCVACSGGAARSDTAAIGDSATAGGPPAIPSTGASPATASPAAAPNSSPTAATTKPSGVKTTSGSETSSAPVPAPARDDSIRGQVSVVGTSFDKRVMIAESGSRRRIEVTGALANMIGHVAGAEIAAWGALSGAQLAVSRFEVRSVDGQPAIDGTLKTEAGVLYIVTRGGSRTRIASPPPPLSGRDGSRVWITGDPAKGVSSFGFIDPPR